MRRPRDRRPRFSEAAVLVSNLPADPKGIGEAVHVRWAMENSIHRVINLAFGEDQWRVRIDNIEQNFAILRHSVSNLLPTGKITSRQLL
ncbi:hypothetical protein [Paraburkholderia humisilvae]|uniref:hypothetical protein n=1 Tax=Paraburkholderia humisilvae TaxID=627669 RepID=UPI0015827B01|nr:hypothetical protein [Paraburkholderia humisilvae]